MKNYLNFELDIKNLEIELEKLKDPYNQEGLSEVDTNKISNIQSEIDSKLKEVYSNLNSWQTVQVARHEDRPKSKYFIENLFENFIPLFLEKPGPIIFLFIINFLFLIFFSCSLTKDNSFKELSS